MEIKFILVHFRKDTLDCMVSFQRQSKVALPSVRVTFFRQEPQALHVRQILKRAFCVLSSEESCNFFCFLDIVYPQQVSDVFAVQVSILSIQISSC